MDGVQFHADISFYLQRHVGKTTNKQQRPCLFTLHIYYEDNLHLQRCLYWSHFAIWKKMISLISLNVFKCDSEWCWVKLIIFHKRREMLKKTIHIAMNKDRLIIVLKSLTIYGNS